MTLLTKKINRYRTVEVRFLSFPFTPSNIEFIGFVKNDGISKMKGLDVFNFDTISYLSTSENGFIHAVGLAGKQLYQLILKNGN
jgi:hypothetical protein